VAGARKTKKNGVQDCPIVEVADGQERQVWGQQKREDGGPPRLQLREPRIRMRGTEGGGGDTRKKGDGGGSPEASAKKKRGKTGNREERGSKRGGKDCGGDNCGKTSSKKTNNIGGQPTQL